MIVNDIHNELIHEKPLLIINLLENHYIKYKGKIE